MPADELVDQVARAQIIAHVDVCTERYGNVWTAVSEIKAMILNNAQITHARYDEISKTTHARYDAISNRMWMALAGTCGSAFIGLAALIFWLITREHH